MTAQLVYIKKAMLSFLYMQVNYYILNFSSLSNIAKGFYTKYVEQKVR